MYNIFRASATKLIFFFIRRKPAILLMGTLDCRLATKYIRSLGISSKTISSNSETPKKGEIDKVLCSSVPDP